MTINSNGITTFNGAIGTNRALSTLTTDAGTAGSLLMNGGNITTTGDQTYGEVVKLGVDTTLNAGAGNVTFINTIDTATSAASERSLTINSNGITTLGGGAGFTRALSTLTTDAGTAGSLFMNGGSITTTSNQSYGEVVKLGVDTTLNAGAGNVTFSNTIDTDATSAALRSLTVNSNGLTTLGGAVGFTRALSTLATDAGTAGSLAMNGGNITTTGNQTYGEIVKLGVDTTLTAGSGNVNFSNTIDTSTGAAAESSLTINGNGVTTFNGAIGTNRALSTLTTDAGTGGSSVMNGSTISTTGNQSFGEVVKLGVDTTLNAGAGNVTFSNTIDTATGAACRT